MKSNNKTDEVKQAEIDLPIFKTPNNNPELHITPENLQSILEYFGIANEFDIIALMCEQDQLRILSYNQSQNVVAEYKGLPGGTSIISPGYFIFETKKILTALQRKYKDSDLLKISWPSTEKITITDEAGKNSYKIPPKTINNLSIPPSKMCITFSDDNRVQFLKRDGGKVVMQEDGKTPVKENAKTFIEIEQDELMKGENDLVIADTDYITYHFENDNCFSIAGSLNPKGDDSQTDDINVDAIKGETLEKTLPKLFLSLIKQLPSGTIEIQAQQDKMPVTVSQWNEEDEIHYAVMENKKKK